MEGFRQGVAVILICVAVTCWTQEILDNSQVYDPSAKVQQIQDLIASIGPRQPLRFKTNGLRRLQQYRKKGMSSINEGVFTENVEGNPTQSSSRSWDANSGNPEDSREDSYHPHDTRELQRNRPNSRTGFRRRANRFKSQEPSLDIQKHDAGGTQENRPLEQESLDENQEFSESFYMENKGKISSDRGHIKFEKQERTNQNINQYTGDSSFRGTDEINTGRPVTPPFDRRSQNAYDVVNDQSFSGIDGEASSNLEKSFHNVEAVVYDTNNNQWLNKGSQLQDQKSLDNINTFEGTIRNSEKIYPRVRTQREPNSGRRRLRAPHRRRFMGMRRRNGRNGFLHRNMKLGLQQKNFQFENQDKLITDNEGTAEERIINPTLFINPNEKAQKMISMQENSKDLQAFENERQENPKNSSLPDSQSNSEGFTKSKIFTYQNESLDVINPSKSDISRNITSSNTGKLDNINQYTPNENLFHRIQNSRNLKSILRRPNDVSVTEDLYKVNNSFEEVNNPTREQSENQENIQNTEFNQRDSNTFSEPKLIPVQFMVNPQQKSERNDNINSGFDQNSPSHHQQNSANNQNFLSNQDPTNEQGFSVSQQQFGTHQQILHPQHSNDQRLYQFQQQIETQRLLQYPQQQINEQGISHRSQKSAQQRQQILDDQRLLQYPEQQTSSQTLSLSPHNNIHQDSSHTEELANADQFLQGPQLQYNQAMPFQKDQQHYTPQYLVDQYFKPAQLGDAFGPGRNSANDRVKQESFTSNPSLGHREGTKVNIEHSGFLPKVDVNQQSRSQKVGRFSTSREIINTKEDQGRISSQINEQPNERDQQNLNFSQQQSRQPQNIHRQSNAQSHFTGNIRRPKRPSVGQQRNNEDAILTVPRIPGRVEPCNVDSSSSKTNGIHSTTRTQSAPTSDQNNADSDATIGFSHERQALDASFTQNSFNDQSTFPTNNQVSQNNVEYSFLMPDRINQGVTNIPTQNNQFNTKRISVRPFDIQRNPSNINGERESLNREFPQENNYFSNLYNRVRQTQKGQFTSSVRSQTFDSNTSQEYDFKDKQVSESTDDKWTSSKESQVTNIRDREGQISYFQQNPDIRFKKGQLLDNRQSDLSNIRPHQPSEISQEQKVSVEQDQIQNQRHNHHKQTTNFKQAPPSSFRQNPLPDFRQGQTSGFSQQQVPEFSQVQDQHSQPKSLSTNQNQFSNTKQISPINHPALNVNIENDTPQYQASIGRAKGGFHQELRNSGIQSINDHTHAPENIQTASPNNLDQGRFQQRSSTYSHGRPSLDHNNLNSDQDTSQKELKQYSNNQGYLPEQQSPLQDGRAREQSFLSKQPLKATNAHGQPGFTYQRNFDSDTLENHKDHKLRGGQLITDDIRQDGISSPDGDTFRQPKFQNEYPLTSSILQGSQSLNAAAERFNKPVIPLQEQTQQKMGHLSSNSSMSGRGNHKFVDTLKGITSELPKKDLIDTIVARLQGRDYVDQMVVSTKIQRTSNEPRLTKIPETGFRCEGRVSGYYADAHDLARCQSFHFCAVDGAKISYLCPAGTIFNQRLLVCDHVFRVECSSSAEFYHVNERFYGANIHQPLRDMSRAFRSFGRRI